MKKLLLALLFSASAFAYTDAEKQQYLNRNMGPVANKVGLGDLVMGGTGNVYVKKSGDSLSGTLNSGAQGIFQGTIAADSAADGKVGEVASASGSAIAVNSTAIIPVTTMTLTAGDWEVEGTTALQTGVTSSVTALTAAVSLSRSAYDSAALGGISQRNAGTGAPWTTTVQEYMPTGVRRINVSTTTPVYLLGQYSGTVFATGNSILANSYIHARRVR